MRNLLIVTTLFVSVFILLISPLQIAAQKTDPESVLRAIFDALNNRDVDGALALVADDAVIIVDQFVSRGKGEMRNWWEGITAVNAFTQASNFQVDGDKATWSATVSIDPWRALGLPPLDHTCEGIVQEGLLKSYSFMMTDESMAKLKIAENKEIARRFLEEIWNKGDMAAADELIAEDFVNHSPPGGREELKQSAAGLLAAFSAPFSIDQLIAEGDKVVMRGTFRSVHKGEFMGIPASGKEFTHTWTAILRIQNGKVVERWANVDSMKFMTDLGVIPAPGEGGK